MRKQIALTLIGVALSAGIAAAQSVGTISGRVTDPSGAAVPNATISAANTATGISRDTMSNNEGIYSLPSLQPGTYDVKVQTSGFGQQERKALELVTGATLSVDFSLSVANVAENVTVNAAAALVDTTESGTSGQLRTSEVQNLPMINRNFQGLIQLLPGARPAPVVNSTRQAFGNGIGVAGGSGRNVIVLMDGADNRDELVEGPPKTLPSRVSRNFGRLPTTSARNTEVQMAPSFRSLRNPAPINCTAAHFSSAEKML